VKPPVDNRRQHNERGAEQKPDAPTVVLFVERGGSMTVVISSNGGGGCSSRLCIPSEFRRIPTEVGQQSPSGKKVKVQITGMCYNTILVILVYSSWYLSTRFLQVEKARTYSK
jgi:hypothetical protein